MSYKHHIIKERFDMQITDAGQVFKGEFELDGNAKIVKGLLITSDKEDLLYYRGSQKIQVNDKELFPENFESKLLMSGLNVSPNRRMVSVGRVETGNGKVEIWFKDSAHPSVEFSSYRISLYVFSQVDNCKRSER